MSKQEGNIVILPGADVWPHELAAAKTLASTGRNVTFLKKTTGIKVQSADLEMNGLIWEMKSPETNNLKALQRILRKAGHQSHNVIIDGTRAKRISDTAMEKELRKLKPLVKSIHRLMLITKDGNIVDIR